MNSKSLFFALLTATLALTSLAALKPVSAQQVAFEPSQLFPSQLNRGSHKMVKICAKIQYTFEKKDGTKISGTTDPERCGDSYRAGHSPDAVEKARHSRQQACDAAFRDLPKLQQGEKWEKRECRHYQVKG
ncbi:hypothetical protein IFO70_38890 [Phormidium tenue FACHB-886]|nr:hypothetical protein [Phormidium tenue FACHB-886]